MTSLTPLSSGRIPTRASFTSGAIDTLNRNASSPTSQGFGQQDRFTPTASAGSVLIQDDFGMEAMMQGGAPHGLLVRGAAHSQGFQGQSIGQFGQTHTSPESLEELSRESTLLRGSALSPADARTAITRYTEARSATLLDDQAAYLEQAAQGCTTHVAANFSLGSSKASVVQSLYTDVALALHKPDSQGAESQRQTLENYANALGLSVDNLTSTDPAIANPERQKLQQGLIDLVSDVHDQSPRIAAAGERWDLATEAFEENSSSVVIAASNEGDVMEQLRDLNGGLSLQTPPDFEQNVLQNDIVTSVGATQRNPEICGDYHQADYSSESEGVDVYASGHIDGLGRSHQGSSFSAPRVAAVMAQLHKDNPNLNSAQIESLMLNNLAAPQNGVSAPVLDSTDVFRFHTRQISVRG